MADLKVTFASTGADLFDLALENLDRDALHTDVNYGVGQPLHTTQSTLPETGLQLETTLSTAVLWSLFTDARVSEDELPEGWTDRRGWVGDDLETDGEHWGSKLWLVTDIPGKATEARRQNAERYAKAALQWLINDRIASRIEATAWWINNDGRLGLHIRIYGGSSAESTALIFESKWALTLQQGEQGGQLS